MKKVPIVFLAADPLRTLSLDEDMRTITQLVSTAENGGVLDFKPCPAARLDDLVQALHRERPQIVHFSGHGSQHGLMLVGAEPSTPDWVSADDLSGLFTTFSDTVSVVVLSACSTGPQAEQIARVVGCAIGTPADIADEAAIIFNAEFYRAIAFGESVKGAHEKACAVLRAKELDQVVPKLEVRAGVDAAQRVLVSRAAPILTRRMAAGAALLVLTTSVALMAGQVLSEPGAAKSPSKVDTVAVFRPGERSIREVLVAAQEFHRTGNYARSFPLFKHAAEAGNPEAMGWLGIAYMRGQGTDRAPDRAAYWLALASHNGDARGMNAYAQAYEEGFGVGPSVRLARHWYEVAATEKKDAEAMRNLARLHREGPDTIRRDSLALAWYLKAVDAGSVDAIVDVGLLYAQGVHGRRDTAEAVRWLQRAVDDRSSRAMHAMGRLHEEASDYTQALAWYRKAADAGSVEAMNSLGALYQEGRWVAPDRAEAARWYRRAAAAGSPVAASRLASLEGG